MIRRYLAINEPLVLNSPFSFVLSPSENLRLPIGWSHNRAELDCRHVDLYFLPPPSLPHCSSLSEESTNLVPFSGQDCLCLFQHNIKPASFQCARLLAAIFFFAQSSFWLSVKLLWFLDNFLLFLEWLLPESSRWPLSSPSSRSPCLFRIFSC
jgi:hypothetical protein